MEYKTISYTDIGRKIRRLRKQKHLTQEQFAERIGRSTSFVGHIERGTRVLSLETFANIIQVLECSANDLLGLGTEEKQRRITAELLLRIAAELADKT